MQLKNLECQLGRIKQMKDLPIEIVITLIGGLYTFMYMIWYKMDQIWKAISKIQKDYVEHDVCHIRRKDCPCKDDIAEIKNKINF